MSEKIKTEITSTSVQEQYKIKKKKKSAICCLCFLKSAPTLTASVFPERKLEQVSSIQASCGSVKMESCDQDPFGSGAVSTTVLFHVYQSHLPLMTVFNLLKDTSYFL